MTNVHLKWSGFYSAADLAAGAAPANTLPGVYLLYRDIGDRPCVYLGSGQIGQRIKTHISSTLGLAYSVRLTNGDWYPPQAARGFWDRVANVDNEIGRFVDAVRNTLFAWAETPADLSNAVERTLYAVLKAHEDHHHLYLDTTKPIEQRRGQVVADLTLTHSGNQEVMKWIR